MASASVRQELTCSICLDTYTEPVTLRCGHNFCRECIDHKNVKLYNLVEHLLSTQQDQETAAVFCTYCIHSPVPAIMSCLMCEASLCDGHLKVHSKSPEHVLCEPTHSLENRKCSIHKELLRYVCTEDAVCICVSCRLEGEHRGHQVDTLEEASEKRKNKLRNNLQELLVETEEAETKIQSLQERRRKMQEKAAEEAKKVTTLFRNISRKLYFLEKKVLGKITKQAERAPLPVSVLIRKLEVKVEELSRKTRQIEELCSMTDPLTVLQESDTGDLCDTEEEGYNEDIETYDGQLRGGEDLDVAGISHTLHTGLCKIIAGIHPDIYVEEAEDILLDVKTASDWLYMSHDRKTVSSSDIQQRHPDTPERFQDYPQVMSVQSFSSGRHYWEVDVGGSNSWRVGMCYPSMDRREEEGESLIGCNYKSWGLDREGDEYSVLHGDFEMELRSNITSNRIRIYLDYEAGQISFYDLCHPIRHLHTFTAAFTEPLHAALCVDDGCVKMSEGRSCMKVSEELEKLEKSTQTEVTSQRFLRFLHPSVTDHCDLQ
ncbi:E3 ubiquitin-protein ligase TRIM11-like [Hyperolius riggenbachi]|uniref:E3 ubiquitin-protein ligase TRIM11-like n=1 Tax=Hyperolius riggenbachi TaxID=752182 RepID=UPI0035A2C64F